MAEEQGVRGGRLSGKSCVVAGAAFGIGRATAELFAAEGANLVLTEIQRDPLLSLATTLRSAGANVETVVGEPAEVARAILFLAADDASFITGAILPVAGGYLAQ